jgi:general secretion pathway protein G
MNENMNPNDNESSGAPAKTGWVFVLLVFVLAIIVAGIVLPRFNSRRPLARLKAAKAQISSLGTALAAFQVDNGHFPRGANGLMELTQRPPGATNWHGPYLERSVPPDPWGHAYIYECPGRHNPQSYDLSSISPDGQQICNWPQK